MKRNELKVYYADLEGRLYESDPFPGHDTATFIRKPEADKVMDTMEAKLKELEEDYRKISEMYIAEQTKAAKYEQRIKELEAALQKERDFGLHIARCADHEIGKLISGHGRAQTK